MGKPNQMGWVMQFHVLGKWIWRYSPDEFEDVDSAVKFIIDKTILSNCMLFGDKHRRHFILQQTGSVDRSDLLTFSWEALCQYFGRGRQLPHHYPRNPCLGSMHGVVTGEDSQSTEYSTWMSCQDEHALHKWTWLYFIHIGFWRCITFKETSDPNQWLWVRYPSSHWTLGVSRKKRSKLMSYWRKHRICCGKVSDQNLLQRLQSPLEHLMQMLLH